MASLLSPSRWRVPPRRVLVWSVVTAAPMAVIICIGAYLSWHYHELLADSRRRVDHTWQVIDALNGVFVALEDAETGQRGFLVTGRDDYLEPYDAATRVVARQQAPLRALVVDSAEQTARADRLAALVAAKLDELGRTIDARRRSGFEAARASVLTGDGKRAMDDVRRQIAAMRDAERTLLDARQRHTAERERDILFIGAAVAAVSVLTRFTIAFVLWRLRRRAASGRPATRASRR